MQWTERREDVVVVRPPSVITREIAVSLIRELEGHLAQRRAYGLMFDLQEAGAPSAGERALLAAHLRDRDLAIQQYVRGMAIVTRSALLRGTLVGVLWVSPLRIPYEAFEQEDEARAWLAKVMGEPSRR